LIQLGGHHILGQDDTFQKTSIHRVLAIRLTIVAIIIAIIFTSGVYLNERDKVGEVVLDRALQAARYFSIQAQRLLDVPGLTNRRGLQRELETFASYRAASAGNYFNNLGYFVYADLLDVNFKRIAQIVDKEYTAVKAVKKFMEKSKKELPAGNKDWYDIIRVEGHPHVKVLVPLANSRGSVVAYLSGVFKISKEAITKVRHRLIKTILSVVAIILVTTAFIYPVIVSLMRRLTKLSLNLLDSHMDTLNVLGSAIAKRDSDTDAHNYRVTIMSVRLAEQAGIDSQTIRGLIKGAFLHDVGKVGIPDSILHKPGRLNDDEYDFMRTHVDKGLDIINRSEWLEDAIAVVVGHHEKVDGTGYPKGLSGEKNPVTARIFAIVDVFDALTSKRPYKEAMSFEDTMKILEKGRGTHFDPKFLDLFNQISRSLYDEYANREDEKLKKSLEKITRRYFSGDFDSLLFSRKIN